MSRLTVSGLEVGGRSDPTLSGVSFTVAEGEAVAIVGGRGSGKTTVLDAVSGLAAITGGSVVFENKDLHRIAAHRRPSLGILRPRDLSADWPSGARLLLVDESVSIDEASRFRLTEWLGAGGSALIASDDVALIWETCRTAVCLGAGRVVGVGPVREMIASPNSAPPGSANPPPPRSADPRIIEVFLRIAMHADERH